MRWRYVGESADAAHDGLRVRTGRAFDVQVSARPESDARNVVEFSTERCADLEVFGGSRFYVMRSLDAL